MARRGGAGMGEGVAGFIRPCAPRPYPAPVLLPPPPRPAAEPAPDALAPTDAARRRGGPGDAPPVTPPGAGEPTTTRGRRGPGRGAGAGVAGLAVGAGAAYAAAGAGPGPGPGITQPMGPALPTPSISLQVHPSFPTTGQVIRTGAPIGGPDRELVLRFVGVGDDTRLVGGLLDRRTGVVRDLEGGAGMTRATATTGG